MCEGSSVSFRVPSNRSKARPRALAVTVRAALAWPPHRPDIVPALLRDVLAE